MKRRKRYYDDEDERSSRKRRGIHETEDERDWLDGLEIEDDFEEQFGDEFLDGENNEQYD